jgi:hypothetical protein
MESLKDQIEIPRVKSLSDLLPLLDAVVKAQVAFDRRFPTGDTELKMAADLIQSISAKMDCWGELYQDGELKFFALVLLREDKTACWQLLHSHPRFRFKTKVVIEQIKKYLKLEREITTVYSKTTRVTPSYKRFMASLGSHQSEIIYKWEL